VRRRLTIAAVLGIVLLIAVALAGEWLWHCPVLGCGSLGTAYYTCPSCGVFSVEAWYTDHETGPPDRVCPSCSTTAWEADSAVCNTIGAHRWYHPFWDGY